MRFRNMMTGVAVPALALMVISAHAARASYIVTFLQDGPDVVATGSGSIDTTDLTDFSGHTVPAAIISSISAEFVGVDTGGGDWSGITGPAAFTSLASAPELDASSASGDGIGIVADFSASPTQFLLLPFDYTSGTALAGTATWSNVTLAGLTLLPGTYVYSWGSGSDADTFTVQIGPASVGVPEPATLGLFASALGALGIFRRRRRTPRVPLAVS